MAKIIAEYDTEDNKLKCSVGGKELTDVMEFSSSKYGDKYSCGIITASMDEENKMKVYTHIVASCNKNVPAQATASPYEGLLWWAEQIAGQDDSDFMKSAASYFGRN